MIPLRDLNPVTGRAVVLWAILASNVVVHLVASTNLEEVIWRFGAIPWHFTGMEPRPFVWGGEVREVEPFEWWFPLRAVTSAWLHGGFLHLLSNMWFLWVFGDNVEARQGHVRFGVFYLLTALAAVAAQVVSDPAGSTPMVGASGAVSGVLGAYLRYFPRVRVIGLVPLGFVLFTVQWTAAAFVGMWVLLQVLGAFMSGGAVGGVAWWAHLGGFAAGYALAPLFAGRRKKRQIEWEIRR